MQNLINFYFSKLCDSKFFKNDDEVIIGKAKDVIENLNQQVEYVKNPDNNIAEEEIEFITDEAKSLINEIEHNFSNKDDVIEISLSPMSGFYVLVDTEDLLEELKEYYDDLELKD